MIAVISSFFNPAGYQSRVNNYFQFRDALLVPDEAFFSAELSFDGRFETDATFKIHGTENNILWQKEALLNYLIKQLPMKYTKVCWVDSDLIFADRHWLEQMEKILDDYPVAQGFSQCVFLNHKGAQERSMSSIAFSGEKYRGAKGMCWGANLSALPDGELMDRFAIGGGDGRLVEAWRGHTDSEHVKCLSCQHHEYALQNYQKYYNTVKNRIGCLPGTVSHLFHGTNENRKTNKRYQILKRHRYDPFNDLIVGDNGVLEWSQSARLNKQSMISDIKQYFQSRKEDVSLSKSNTVVFQRNVSRTRTTTTNNKGGLEHDYQLWKAAKDAEPRPQRPDYRPFLDKSERPQHLAVIAVLFNPAGWNSIYRNWDQFIGAMGPLVESGQIAQLVKIELGETGRGNVQIPFDPERHSMWQKEALINRGLRELRDDIDAVCAIDADIYFGNVHWPQHTLDALSRYRVVQMFRTLRRPDRNGLCEEVYKSIGSTFLAKQPSEKRVNPGTAWAWRRDVIDEFYPYQILGGGDTMNKDAWIGWWSNWYCSQISEPMRAHWFEWAWDTWKRVRGSVGFVEGEVTHMWHGDKENRNYRERNNILVDHQYYHVDHIITEPSGILAWNNNASRELRNAVKQYFRARKED